MDWVLTIVAGLAFLVLLSPLIFLLATAFILMPLAHLLPLQPAVARATFDCPFSRRRVNAAFLAVPGEEAPRDVLSCSVFTDARGIRCRKGCLGLATTGWKPSPMTPAYSLVADGVALRDLAR